MWVGLVVQGGGASGAAVGDIQFGEDGGDVMVDRANGKHQVVGYFGIREARADEFQDLLLARGETGRVIAQGPAAERGGGWGGAYEKAGFPRDGHLDHRRGARGDVPAGGL